MKTVEPTLNLKGKSLRDFTNAAFSKTEHLAMTL